MTGIRGSIAKALLFGACSLSLQSCNEAPRAMEVSSDITLALSNMYRPEAERARDTGRKPGEILAFYDLKKGMTVYEVGAGSGYYTDLMSQIVGQEGRIFAQYSKQSWNRSKEEFSTRFSTRGNIVPYIGQRESLKLPDNSFDFVMVALIWHHMHYDEASGDVLPPKSQEFLANSLRLLKPGGTLAIIEHEAKEGSDRKTAAQWHRSTKASTIADIVGHGFEYIGASEALQNPDDDLANSWRSTFEERDMSQRFVLKFMKPAG